MMNNQHEAQQCEYGNAVMLDNKKIRLEEKDSKYYYGNDNYSMIIEPIHQVTEIKNLYSGDFYNAYENGETDLKFNNVTIIKPNGEKQSSIVYLPNFIEEDITLIPFSNGYIEYENEGSSLRGWYDINGNQQILSSKYNDYYILDIRNDKIYLVSSYTPRDNSGIIIDTEGQVLLDNFVFWEIHDNMCLIENSDKKMILLDNELKAISNEYDKIYTNEFMVISYIMKEYEQKNQE